MLNQGVEPWNQWRRTNPDIEPDLSGADLSDARLGQINFQDTNLSSARLGFADLSLANLEGANLSSSHISSATLSFANLTAANLSGATLSFASLRFADCRDASLSGANLSFADLSHSDCANVLFSRADLSCAQLQGTILRGSDLSRATLSGATLAGANLVGAQALTANLNQCVLTGAVVADWQIGQLTQLEGVQCDYLYRCCHPETGEPAARLPADPSRTLAPGEFSQHFCAEVPPSTIELHFEEGIDWRAFSATFQQLRQECPRHEIAVCGMWCQEDTFTICLEVPSSVDPAEIEACASQFYQAFLDVPGADAESFSQARHRLQTNANGKRPRPSRGKKL